MAQEPAYERTGRGGAGNFRRPSNDPDNTSTAKSILKEIKDSASAIISSKNSPSTTGNSKVEYVHHGRGGAGNLSTIKDQVTPVKSIIDEKGPKEAKPVVGRGGAGNIRSASKERATSSEQNRGGNVVDVPSSVSEAAEANARVEAENEAASAVHQPEPAHLAEGREIVHGESSTRNGN